MTAHLPEVSSSVILVYLKSYLPYKVYTVLITMRVIRINMIIFSTFSIISFLNRCINPFIYASQYEVVRRAWTPLAEFVRRHVTRQPAASAVAMVEPVAALPASSSLSRPAKQETPVS